jgi:hypothetical protein
LRLTGAVSHYRRVEVVLVLAAVVLVVWRRTRRGALIAAGVVAVNWYLIFSHALAALVCADITGLAVYWLSIRISARVTHGACSGRGRFSSRLFPWRFRLCGGCGGNGRTIAWGVKFFGTERAKDERRVELEARRRTRRFAERS